ncbi:MAG: calcium-binding protein [Pseudomonadota bacterium]
MDAALLPPLFAAGTLGNSRDAYDADPALEQAAKDLAALLDAGDLSGFMADFEDHLLDWAGVRGADAQARGVFVDARHLAFLEAWHGADFALRFPLVDPAHPSAPEGAMLEEGWLDLMEMLAARFIAASAQASADIAGVTLASLNHPLEALAPFAANRTQQAPALDATPEAATAAIVDAVVAGDLSNGEAAMLLRLLRHDLGADVTTYFTAVEAALLTDPDQASAGAILALLAAGYATELRGTGAADTLMGSDGADVIFGGTGDDVLRGGLGDDVYHYSAGDGADRIVEDIDTHGNRVVVAGYVFADASIAAAGAEGRDLLIDFGGGNSVTVDDALTYAFRAPLSSIAFDDVTHDMAAIRAHLVAVQATTGDDTIRGTVVADTLAGGLGNDTLIGDIGADLYQFARGDGQDVIEELGITYLDVLEISGYAASEVLFARGMDPEDLVVAFTGTTDTITIRDGFRDGGARAIEQFRLDDGGVLWTMEAVSAALVASLATPNDDFIRGTVHADTLEGGAGNDTLQGAEAGDTYVFSVGDGVDEVRELGLSGHDALHISGYTSDQVRFHYGDPDADDIVVSFFDSNDQITIKDQLRPGNDVPIESVVINGVDVVTAAEIAAAALLNQQTDPFTLIGTAGNDTLEGTDTDEILWGRLGDDFLSGKNGSDNYRFQAGDGHDHISDGGGDGTDTLTISGYATDTVVLSLAGTSNSDLVVGFMGSSTDSITIDDGYAYQDHARVELITFDDGTTWSEQQIHNEIIANQATDGDDVISGTNRKEVLRGGLGNDTLNGLLDDDTYVFARGDGNDVIEDKGHFQSHGFDRLVIEDYTQDEVTLSPSGATLLLTFFDPVTLLATGDTITIIDTLNGSRDDQIEEISFSDGTLWEVAAYRHRSVDDQASDGDDVVTGSTGSESLAGGLGNDTLHGGIGDDTYVFARGDGADIVDDNGHFQNHYFDRVRIEGYMPDEVRLTPSGNNIVMTFLDTSSGAPTGDTITIVGTVTDSTEDRIEEISFLNGPVWDVATYRGRLAADQAGDGNDVITGSSSGETLAGGRGDDTLHGGNGSDTYIYFQGDGRDVIEDNGNRWSHDDDKLIIYGYDPSQARFSSGHITLTITFTDADGTPSTDRITIRNTLKGDTYDRIEEIVFGDTGTVLSFSAYRQRAIDDQATDSNDVIMGSPQADRLEGGLGNDTLHGREGNDTYVFNRGDGQDRIDENGHFQQHQFDQLVINGYTSDEVLLRPSGSSLILTFVDPLTGQATGDTVTIVDSFNGSRTDQIEQISFADDGTVWSVSGYRQRAVDDQATDGNDIITASAGSDRLEGGLGNDTLHGREGNDTYVFNHGDGQDKIDDNGHFQQHHFDRLIINDYSSSEVILSSFGNSLNLTFIDAMTSAPTGDSILIQDTLNGSRHDQIEEISFSFDGTVWDVNAYKQQLINPAAPNSASAFRGSFDSNWTGDSTLGAEDPSWLF